MTPTVCLKNHLRILLNLHLKLRNRPTFIHSGEVAVEAIFGDAEGAGFYGLFVVGIACRR